MWNFCRTFVLNFLLGTFVWSFSGTFTRNCYEELLLGTFVWNFFWYFHTERLWRTFVRNFRVELSRYFRTELFVGNFLVELSWCFHTELFGNFCWNFLSSEELLKFCCLVFNSESLGRSFTGLPRRPTLRVCTNLSADLVDFHFSDLWVNYVAPICWFLISSLELFQTSPGRHKIGPF